MVRMVRLELTRSFEHHGLGVTRLPFRHMRMVLAKGVEPLIRDGIRT